MTFLILRLILIELNIKIYFNKFNYIKYIIIIYIIYKQVMTKVAPKEVYKHINK